MHTFVYLIVAVDSLTTTKIGVAKQPEVRLGSLQTGNVSQLSIKHVFECDNDTEAFALETHLHRRYNTLRVHGEWYRINWRRVVDYVDSMEPIISLNIFERFAMIVKILIGYVRSL